MVVIKQLLRPAENEVGGLITDPLVLILAKLAFLFFQNGRQQLRLVLAGIIGN